MFRTLPGPIPSLAGPTADGVAGAAPNRGDSDVEPEGTADAREDAVGSTFASGTGGPFEDAEAGPGEAMIIEAGAGRNTTTKVAETAAMAIAPTSTQGQRRGASCGKPTALEEMLALESVCCSSAPVARSIVDIWKGSSGVMEDRSAGSGTPGS